MRICGTDAPPASRIRFGGDYPGVITEAAAIPLATWKSVDRADSLRRRVAALTPRARKAFEQAVLQAFDVPAADDRTGAELVNTDVEDIEAPTGDQVEALVRRASHDGSGAPMVKIGQGEQFALLVSPRHVWDLVDRVDDLQASLAALATVLAIGRREPNRLAAVLSEIGIDIHRERR